MLLELKIKNFLLIENTHLSFEKGFIVFTGETGAGKSLLIKALKLLLGDKGGANYLKSGAERAEIEALFSINKPLTEKLKEMGYEVEDEIHIKRIITPHKQRAFLNGSLITLSELSSLAQNLLSITSQHEHYTFLHRDNQIKLLDEILGLKEIIQTYQESFSDYLRLKKELWQLQEKIKEASLKKDYLLYQISELEELKPDPKEEEELLRLRDRLKHLTQIKELLFLLKNSLNQAQDHLALSINYLHKLAQLEPTLTEREKNVQGLYYEIKELEREIQNLEKSLPEDDRSLDEIESRLVKYERLKKKYRKSTEELILLKEELKRELSMVETGEEELQRLTSLIEKLEKKLIEMALQISETREKGKGKVEELILNELHQLGMEKAFFEIALKRRDALPSNLTNLGFDEIEFLFSPNPGIPPRPIEKVASGGELSRMYLALRSLTKESKSVGTLIFDEVDTGIGGETAFKIGEKLKELSKEIQIICITHLPQIARLADHHYVVEKYLSESESKSIFRKVEGRARLQELARMLGDKNNMDLALKFLQGAL
ncbi:MAG: DNA repair protein RecN [Caldimicrobium sp.]